MSSRDLPQGTTLLRNLRYGEGAATPPLLAAVFVGNQRAFDKDYDEDYDKDAETTTCFVGPASST